MMLSGDALKVWTEHYETDPSTISSKLRLGHDAYQAALSNSTLSLMEQKIMGKLESIEQRADMAKTASKLTSKGRETEASFVNMLKETGAFAEVYQITEKDTRGKIGGDILVRDRENNGCVIEMKDKVNLTIDDFTKFEQDARAWQGTEQLFVFCRRDGVGTNRRLQSKMTFESITPSRSILWFKGDMQQLCEQLAMILSTVSHGIRHRESDNDIHMAKLMRAKDSFSAELVRVRARLGAIEKEKLELHKSEAMLVSAIQDVDTNSCGSKRPMVSAESNGSNKRPIIMDGVL